VLHQWLFLVSSQRLYFSAVNFQPKNPFAGACKYLLNRHGEKYAIWINPTKHDINKTLTRI
jgi:hypothetical protein